MNVWMKKAITDNPYYRTAFRLTKVSRELVQHKTVVKQISRTKTIIDVNPQAHVINGQEASHAEINAAEEIIMNPEKRMYEELLEHASEKLNMKAIKNLIEEINILLEPDALDELQISSLNFLKAWAQHLMLEYVENTQEETASFGYLEMKVIPPFGLTGDGK